MTIKKKIRLSNIMMVLIPILVTTVVLIVYLNTSLGSYWAGCQHLRIINGISRHRPCCFQVSFRQVGIDAFPVLCDHKTISQSGQFIFQMSHLICILRYLAVILIIFVALTVCINGVLSWWISGSILKPLGKLSLGTKEIREGGNRRPVCCTQKGCLQG